MWDPMWMLASFQSTSVPFIQILPVPGKAIVFAPSEDLIRVEQDARMSALQFAAERAFRRPGLERLLAVPAEGGLGRFARAEAGLDLAGIGDWGSGVGRASALRIPKPGSPIPAWARRAREQVLEELGGTLIPLRHVAGERLEHDVVHRLRDLAVLDAGRGDELAAHQPLEL